ncbi:hypothetical protein G6F51_014545 [Rhizopus arrhizus]|uniref:Uncharacterized protein n=1 Tax=Rhizopus oryzae TaxID=64495 RepID=A0A9P6XLH0_RHIOR|nr:hypothetical protein G6F51_014545 [Rhizopus arrhizus]
MIGANISPETVMEYICGSGQRSSHSPGPELGHNALWWNDDNIVVRIDRTEGGIDRAPVGGSSAIQTHLIETRKSVVYTVLWAQLRLDYTHSQAQHVSRRSVDG